MNTRRRLWLAGAGAALAGWALRPGLSGAPHDAYFSTLAQALRQSGRRTDASTPVLVIDHDRLQANVRQVQALKAPALPLRVVAKSLPATALLQLLAQQLQSQRQMVFNLPYLLLHAAQFPTFDLLLGKPLPVAAAAAFYAQRPANGFDPGRQLQWLIDSPARLAEYRQLAQGLGQRLRVNLEIDVGLHRGGFSSAAALDEALALLRTEPLLEFAGMMGYDPHVTEIPDLPGARASAEAHAKAVYAQYRAQAVAALGLPAAQAPGLCWNAAGSPTFQLHDGSGAANEVSVGSAFVKPAEFDLPHLAACQPACFIATPVLKSGAFMLPSGVQWLGQLLTAWDRNQRHGVFLYGGQWRADPVSPAGLATSGLYGLSPNQQVLVGSGLQQLQPGDTVFLRPHKSEALLQQFGDIVVVASGQVVAHWPAFPPMP
ncbi:DSD1 family PLP-dependent enzyme [Acidovorax sp. HDW3]|uniref:alanine racemase n=1 Tax=Acidovorax sp. HDW3 TaxID=2714923 RepID=UPI0014099C5F|nr:alanine racemase [Acidovorax sp. HDW3]QIL43255.1 DSD1 family PLP-dependent enzyme [Acidovorax sp. HDW3]